MTLGTRPAHVARAALEAIAWQIGDVLDAMEADLGLRLADLSIDGGAARNDFLAQLLADLTGRAVVRPEIAEASALGAARMAWDALGFGDWRTPDAARFEPELAPERRAAIGRGWRAAMAAAVPAGTGDRSEEHKYELQSLTRHSYAGLCVKTKNTQYQTQVIE